jgi:hypothetical protein
MKLKVRFKLERLYPTLSIIVPAAVRWIPEAQFPYPIGFDTPWYLASAKLYAENLQPFPLLYFILGRLYNVGIDPLISMKIMPTALYGLLGLSTFLLARRTFMWSGWKSLILVLAVALSPAMLRASWDLNKQALALIFFISSLSLLRSLRSLRSAAAFIILSVLTSMSHELIFGLMTAVYILLALNVIFRVFKGEEADLKKISTLLLSIGLSSTVFIGFWYGWNFKALAASTMNAGVTTSTTALWPEKFTQLFLFYNVGLIPLAILGFFRNEVAIAWLIAAAVGSFSIILPPRITISIPERWFILIAYPIAVFAANSVSRLRLNSPKPEKAALTIALILLCNSFSLPLLGLSAWPSIIRGLEGYVPTCMASSSIPLSDIEATRKLIAEINQTGKSVLITHIVYAGWVKYFNPQIPLIAFAEWYSTMQTAAKALEAAKTWGYSKIYLLWYVENEARELGFKKISGEGGLSLYTYAGSD